MAGDDATPEAPAAPEMNPKMFVVPALMMGVKYLKLDLNLYKTELRIAFAMAVLFKYAVIYYVYLTSQKAAEAGPVTVKEKKMDGTEEEKTMTTREYDAQQIMTNFKSGLFGLCITCGIHYKWGNASPLLFQSIMLPMGLLDDNLFKIHILQNAAVGKLARPFKAPESPFAALAEDKKALTDDKKDK
mmetsp:Transcript_22977/g.41061  ORF Transcript_22977/g.41061 Transcript_22977/m.41061 type:complete len:187 (+) Transcript_22977:46-606(+)